MYTLYDILNVTSRLNFLLDLIDTDQVEKLEKLDLSDYIKKLVFYCIYQSKNECCKMLITKLTNLNERFLMGNTYLNCAVQSNNIEIVEYLLIQGSNPNIITIDFYGIDEILVNPLASAVKNNFRDIVNILIKHNAYIGFLIYSMKDVFEYNDINLTKQIIDIMEIEQLYNTLKYTNNPEIIDYINHLISMCWNPFVNKINNDVKSYILTFLI